ncbi:MAG: hypothetical protein E6Q76_06010, partial [Rhizobium sp.]
MMIFYCACRLTVAGVGLFLFANPAFALDGADVLNKLNSAIVAQIGDAIDAKSVDINGSTVILKSATYTPKGRDGIALGDVTMTGVAERAGGYTIEKVLIPDVTIRQKDFSASVSGLWVDNLEIPANATLSDMNSIFVYHAHIGPVSGVRVGEKFFSITAADSVSTKRADNKGVDSSFTIDGIVADLSLAQMPVSAEAIRYFELQNLRATFSMKSSWELSTGKYDLTDYTIDLANMGKLNVKLSLSGVTPAFYNTADALYSSMTGTEDDQDTKNAKYLLGLAFVQQLTLNSAQIRFDDASITNRAFDYASKLEHVTRAQSANRFAKEMLELTAALDIPDLQRMLSRAIVEYSNNPGSLTFSAT